MCRVDGNTGPESVQAFLELDATFWQVNGTHRCANDAVSDCSGTTDTCGENDGRYHVSDVVHFTRNFFQVANDTVAETLAEVFAIQFHSFGVCSNGDPDDTPLAQLSNVSSAKTPNSMATRLAVEINARAFATGYPGWGAVSWNATEDDPAGVQVPDDVCRRFNGGANVQGRSLHGSADPCRTSLGSAVPSPERFVHLEQRPLLTRGGPGGPDHFGVSRDIVIAAIADAFPASPQRWVQFSHFGLELGTFALPHNTLTEAVNAASSGETIRLRAGSSAETGVFSRRVTLRGFDGRALIGD